MHRLPDAPYTAAFGESRPSGGPRSSPIEVLAVRCPTPTATPGSGSARSATRSSSSPVRAAGQKRWLATRRCRLGDPPSATTTIPRSHEPRERRPRPTSRSEEQFLALGEGAKRYLVEGAASGARRLEARMAEAVCFAALHGVGPVDEALGLVGNGRALLGGRSRVDPRARRWRTGGAQRFTRRALLGPGHLVVEQLQDAKR